jgi:hypothetical protein
LFSAMIFGVFISTHCYFSAIYFELLLWSNSIQYIKSIWYTLSIFSVCISMILAPWVDAYELSIEKQ